MSSRTGNYPIIRGSKIVQTEFIQTGTQSGGPNDQGRWTPSFSVGAGSGVTQQQGSMVHLIGGGTGGAGSYGGFWYRNQSILPANIGLVSLFEPSTTTSTQGMWCLRAQSLTTVANVGVADNCYYLRWSATTGFAIYKVVSGTSTSLVSGTVSIASGGLYWVRFEIIGNTLTGKLWQHPSGAGTSYVAESAATVISVTDDTFSQPGVMSVNVLNTGSGTDRIFRLYSVSLYEPQTIGHVPNIFLPFLSPIVGQARTFAAKVATASDCEAVVHRTQRNTVKLSSSPSAKATPILARRLANKISAATNLHTATMQVSGTISFSAVISETKNLRLRRIAPPAPAGQPRLLLAKAATTSVATSALRRTVRRTGKTASSTSSRASLSYRKLFTVVGALNKPKFAINAKAVLDTTTTAQGNAPAIPATIANGVPGDNCFMWANYWAALTGRDSYTFFDATYGFNGIKGTMGGAAYLSTNLATTQHFYYQGTDVTNIADPRLNTTDSHYDYHQAYMSYGVPGTNGGAYGTVTGSPLGPYTYKRDIDPTFKFFIGWYCRQLHGGVGSAQNPYMDDWYDDALWVGYARTVSNWAAGLKFINADGITWDCESAENFDIITTNPRNGPLVTSTNRPAGRAGMHIYESDTAKYMYYSAAGVWTQTTLNAIHTLVEARGFQVGSAAFAEYPNMSVIVYEWRVAGGAYESSNRNSTYPRDKNVQDSYFFGWMRAMQEANGQGVFWQWDANYYKRNNMTTAGSSWVANAQRGMQGSMALMSQRLAPAVRDHMMMRYANIIANWAGTDGGAGYPNTGEPEYNSLVVDSRKYSMHGTRSEYMLGYNGNEVTGPVSVRGVTPAVNLYHDTRGLNPPGDHRPGLQSVKAMGTTPQDVLSVGSPPVNTSAPAVTGTVAVGSVLTCGQGSWTNAPTSYAYMWQRETANLAGGNTYTVVTADIGSRLRCQVTATNAGGSTSVFSAYTIIVPNPATRDVFLWPYASDSPWNYPIGSGATFGSAISATGWVSQATTGYNPAIYRATTSDPLVHVTPTEGGTNPFPTDVRIPANIIVPEPTGGDRNVQVLQPDGNTLWSSWMFYWTVVGQTATVGVWSSESIRGSGWNTGWCRAVGVSPSAGSIRLHEVQAAATNTPHAIPHAMPIAMQGGLYTLGPGGAAPWPQDGNYGDHPGEGTLFAIPSTTPKPAGITGVANAVWEACRDYGAYDCDTTGGSTVSFFLDQAIPDAAIGNLWTYIDAIVAALRVVTNNTQATPGGPGTRLAPIAPTV